MEYISVINNLDNPTFRYWLDIAYNRTDDRLHKNYNIKQIARMKEYGMCMDGDEFIYMVGLDDFSKGIYRIESRLWVNPKYRKKFWKSPDNYATIFKQINLHKSTTNFLFKSREAPNPGGFRISARLHKYFTDWVIYPKQIELKWKDNWQWIMYRPCHNSEIYIKELQYYERTTN